MNTLREGLERKKGEIQKVVKNGMFLHIPVIKPIDSPDQQFVKEAVERRRQYIATISGHMVALVTRIREIQSASAEEKSARFKELKGLEDELLIHLNSEEELLASAARQAYALAMVSTLPLDKRAVIETIRGSNNRLPGLLDLKILEPVGDAKNVFTVKVYGDTYKVGGSRDFATKLAENLSIGAAHAAKAAHELYHSEAKGLKAQATISVAEMLEKKPGRLFLTAPDVRDGDRFLPGGVLLAESNGEVIKVLQVRGHFHRTMTEIAEAKIFVFVESLNRERFGFEGSRLSDEKFRLCRILHAVLRRGIVEALAK